MQPFSDPDSVARYAEGPVRLVPGFLALQQMTRLLLAERLRDDGDVLVLGAGGGLELLALARMQPEWSFVGVDPSANMLALAERTLGDHMERVELVEGFIDAAPSGPFDAAACLLTLHFMDEPERRRTVRQIHRRLKPGAPFVTAHGSFPQQDACRTAWLNRYVAYAVASGGDPAQAKSARDAIEASSNVTMLDPETDERILRECGFPDAELFVAAFTWRGWIGHASEIVE